MELVFSLLVSRVNIKECLVEGSEEEEEVVEDVELDILKKRFYLFPFLLINFSNDILITLNSIASSCLPPFN